MIFLIRVLLILPILLLIGCASTPEAPQTIPQATNKTPLVSYALSLQGKPYRYGKSSPEEGFDCSGFVRHVYQKQGILLPRTSREMAAYLPPMPLYKVQSGDLVFFNIDGRAFSHVGIYVNNQQFIHAPSQRSGKVMVSSLNTDYWHKRFIGVRRPALMRVAN